MPTQPPTSESSFPASNKHFSTYSDNIQDQHHRVVPSTTFSLPTNFSGKQDKKFKMFQWGPKITRGKTHKQASPFKRRSKKSVKQELANMLFIPKEMSISNIPTKWAQVPRWIFGQYLPFLSLNYNLQNG